MTDFDQAIARREELWAQTHAEHERIHREIEDERHRQDTQWGPQNHPDGTGPGVELLREPRLGGYRELQIHANQVCDTQHRNGKGTWDMILVEEVFEALAESDQRKLRRELVQMCAVGEAWIAKIDRESDARR